MTNRTPYLILLALIFVLSGCKKWSFDHKLSGTYNGTWDTRFDYQGYPQIRTFLDNVIVGDYKKNSFSITSTSDMTDGLYYGKQTFEYNSSNEYYYERRWHTGTVDQYKAIFKPKQDSLIIYTHTGGPVFTGKRR